MEATAQESTFTLPSSTFSSSSHFPLSLSLSRACVRMRADEFFPLSAIFFHRADASPSSPSSSSLFFLSSLPPISLLRCCLFSALSLSLSHSLSLVRGREFLSLLSCTCTKESCSSFLSTKESLLVLSFLSFLLRA